MKSRVILIILIFSSLAGLSQPLKIFADSVRQHYNIPEISYAVISSKQIFELEALGLHSVSLKDAATLEDRFHIGSNTKAMTAYMIARYVEKGKLKWTTEFFTLFPEWKSGSKPEYYNMTLQDLLSHRAGIQAFQGEDDAAIPEFTGTPKKKREAFGEFVLTLSPADHDPTNKFFYSNAGYTLATLMLEKVTGKSWEELVEKVFNKDLKLNVKIGWPDNQSKKDTWGHSFENGKLNPIPSDTAFNLDYTEPAGDINIRLKDYIRFIQLNLNGLAGNNNYLKASTYNFIHNGIEDYSLGWFNIKENGKEFSTHFGTAGTYYSLVQIDRIHNKAYIIFTNSFSDDTVQGVRLLMRKLKEKYIE
ncbi:MAG: serine hydrolase domain-containing protein [Chitinophagaceae bacterium]